jgi:Ran GTPase-activating protein (RanGAP) involved in mRNA processing and transport
LDDDILPLVRPDSFSKGPNTAVELVNLKRNGQRGRQTSVLIEKLEKLSNRIDNLEKQKKDDSDIEDSDKEDKKDDNSASHKDDSDHEKSE